MASETAVTNVVVAMAAGWPALGALAIAAWLARGKEPSERTVVRITTWTLALSFLSVAFATARLLMAGHAVDVRLGDWYRAADHGYELVFLVDGFSAPIAIVASILQLATCRFSAGYLHNEPGFVRFFALMLVFAAGFQLLVLGGGVEILFAGWEVVGMTSVLLVAFFHERRGPVRAAIRVLATYRLCDVGLVLAAVFLHQSLHTTVFANMPASGAAGANGGLIAAAVIGLLVAAMGKSAQFPVGGWLPRAMEGPTASSAVFYGSLSVHAGVYLLARAAPLYEHSFGLRAAIVGVGLVTAAIATLSGQVTPDAKTAIAYSTTAQVGMMFAECGLGYPRLAVAHLAAHALLRYYQFLRTPSVLQDALERRAALGATTADESAARWEVVGVGWRRFLYRLAIERFEGEAMLERWIARPALWASAALDRIERTLMTGEETKSPPQSPTDGPATEVAPLAALEGRDP